MVATWGGNSTHETGSGLDNFGVVSLGCIIATATYGSELSPEVQFLRGFRDNTVLTTFAGSNFMTLFNSIYYSISPAVASVIASNEVIRSMAKVTLYPLMGILHVGVEAYSLFSFSPELGIIVFCLVVSSLIGIVYLAPLALLFSLLKKKTISAEKIRLVSLIWAGSITAVLVAELAKSPPLMMASSGLFVVTTAFATTLVMVRAVMKRYIGARA